MQGLVHIGLGGGNIVLEAALNGAVHIVHQAEAVIAVAHRVHNDAHRVDIVDLLKALALHIHLAVDAVHGLDAPLDGGVVHDGLHTGGDAGLELVEELVVPRGLLPQRALDLGVGHRIQIADGEVLQLVLDGPDT